MGKAKRDLPEDAAKWWAAVQDEMQRYQHGDEGIDLDQLTSSVWWLWDSLDKREA